MVPSMPLHAGVTLKLGLKRQLVLYKGSQEVLLHFWHDLCIAQQSHLHPVHEFGHWSDIFKGETRLSFT